MTDALRVTTPDSRGQCDVGRELAKRNRRIADQDIEGCAICVGLDEERSYDASRQQTSCAGSLRAGSNNEALTLKQRRLVSLITNRCPTVRLPTEARGP